MTEKRAQFRAILALQTRISTAHKLISAYRLLAQVFLLVCSTLGTFMSVLFLASDGEPTRMIGGLLEQVSSWSVIYMGSVINVLEIILIASFINFLLPALLAACRAKDSVQQEKTEQSLVQMIAHTLAMPADQIQRTGDFFEYGGDAASLDVLLSAIKHHWQISLEAQDVFDHPRVSQLAKVIVHRQRQRAEMEDDPFLHTVV
jgi:Phosphopantetheine attachment site